MERGFLKDQRSKLLHTVSLISLPPLKLCTAVAAVVSYFFFTIISSLTASVRNVQAKWLNSSAVQLSWDTLVLPGNVEVLEYLAYFSHGNREEEGGSHQWRFKPESECSIVTGLGSHAVYSFSVAALIRDSDGTVFETRGSPIVRVFIPGI